MNEPGYPTVDGLSLNSHPILGQLVGELRHRHHDALCAVLVYGSCLRSGDIHDGLLDLYLICDSYRQAYQRKLPAIANSLLPPNVFYAQTDLDGRTLRAKVTVISLRDFRRGCSRAWFESYIWGRFAQPTQILYCRDQQCRKQVQAALMTAVQTLLNNAVPLLPDRGTVLELWQRALALSYDTELRTERNTRAGELVNSAAAFYHSVTRHQQDCVGFHFALYDEADQLCYRAQPGSVERRRARLAWALRRAQGKLLSIARLVKALFTFDGGLDYIAWKLQRHSGQDIVVPERVRRAPLIFLWGFFWKLYRRGIFK